MKLILTFLLLVFIQTLPLQARHSSRFIRQKEAASVVSVCVVSMFIENNKQSTVAQDELIKEALTQDPKPKKADAKTKTLKVEVLREDGIDPVCNMKVTKGTTSVSTFGGKQYGFCSGMCKERFDKNPDKYLSKVKK